MKALSVEFSGVVNIGVILGGAEPEMATSFGIEKVPALVQVLDANSLKSEHFREEFKKPPIIQFFHRAIRRHQQKEDDPSSELTAQRFKDGKCSATDKKFCFFYVDCTSEELSSERVDVLRKIGSELKTYRLLRIYTVRDQEFAQAFDAVDCYTPSFLLYRPKRQRYKVFEGNPFDTSALASFVSHSIETGLPLPLRVATSPEVRQEL